MDITVQALAEYGLLGVLLAGALWVIQFLYRQQKDTSLKFAEKVEQISTATNETNLEISNKFADLHRETIRDFKDMHEKSLELVASSRAGD